MYTYTYIPHTIHQPLLPPRDRTSGNAHHFCKLLSSRVGEEWALAQGRGAQGSAGSVGLCEISTTGDVVGAAEAEAEAKAEAEPTTMSHRQMDGDEDGS